MGYADLGGEDLSIHFDGIGAVVDIQQETTGDMKGPLDLVFQTPTKGDAEGDTVATIHVPRLEDFIRKLSSLKELTVDFNKSKNENTFNRKPLMKHCLGSISGATSEMFQSQCGQYKNVMRVYVVFLY